MAVGRKKPSSTSRSGQRREPAGRAPATGGLLPFGPFELRQFEKNPSPMCVFDRETMRSLAVNDAALRLYGYTHDEFMGLTLRDTRHPSEDAEHIPTASDQSRFPRHCGLRRHIKKSGDVFLADVVVQDILFEGRQASLVLLLDMTERARIHMQRLEREQLFSALVEHSPDIIARIDRELRHVYVNPAASTLTGLTPEQLAAKTDRQPGVPLELCVRWAAGARRAFATGRQQEIEITFPTPDGERHYTSHMVPELGADGQVESVLAIARDITQRKHMELALRASETKLRQTQHEFETLADALPQVISCYDRELRYTYVNAAVESVTGLPRATIIGRTNAELGFPAGPVAQREESLRRVLETGRPLSLEIEYPTLAGPRQYEAQYIPLAREDGAVETVIAVAYDITERRHAESERLSLMSRQRDTLIREVHHRVKNNLQGVVGLLRQLANMNSSLAPLLDKAISQLQAMAVVHGLHGRELRDGVILEGLIAEITKSVERTTGVPIWYKDEPQSGAPLHVREDDAVSVALVLNELILNAAKHGTSKRGAGTLAVMLKNDGRGAQVSVMNDGKLPPDFDFGGSSGLGTGLDLVKALLPSAGAQLGFSAKQGQIHAVLKLDSPVLERGAETAKEMPNEWDRRRRPHSDRRR